MLVIGNDDVIDYLTDNCFSCYINKPKYYYKFNDDNKINSIITEDIDINIKDNLAFYNINEEKDKEIKPEEFNINNIKTIIINKKLNKYDWLKYFKNVEYIFISECEDKLDILNDLKNLNTLILSKCKNILLSNDINLIKLCISNCNNDFIIPNYKNLKVLDIAADKTFNFPNYLSSIEELYYYINDLKEIPKDYINLKKFFISLNTKYSMIDVFNYIKYLFSSFNNLIEINVFNCNFKEKNFKDNINMLFFKNKIINFYCDVPIYKLIKHSTKLYYNKDYNISYFGFNIFVNILMNEGLL